MRRSQLSLSLLVSLLAACGADDDGDRGGEPGRPDAGAPPAAAVRTYEHRLPDCESGGLFNCAPSITLCEGGAAFMLVTDIVNAGTYTEDGTTIVTRFEAGDVPDMITFTASDDGRRLVDDWQSWEWLQRDEPDESMCP